MSPLPLAWGALCRLPPRAMRGTCFGQQTALHALQRQGNSIFFPAKIAHPSPLLQATLTYAQELEEQVAAGSSTDEAKAEGIAFFRTIQPLVAQVGWVVVVVVCAWGGGGGGGLLVWFRRAVSHAAAGLVAGHTAGTPCSLAPLKA